MRSSRSRSIEIESEDTRESSNVSSSVSISTKCISSVLFILLLLVLGVYFVMNVLHQEFAIINYMGGRYHGAVRFWIPHGRGTLFFRDGSFYTGTFVNGIMHGRINSSLSNGTVRFSGTYVNGKAEGYGEEIVEADGGRTMYKGQWKNDKRSGEGTMEYFFTSINCASTYNGHWEHDRRHGYGVQKGKSGKVLYAGQWSYGSPLLISDNILTDLITRDCR